MQQLQIIKEGKKILRQRAKEVALPIDDQTHNDLVAMHEYLVLSQDSKYALENNIRPGVGLAAPQIGISKRMFVIHIADDEYPISILIVNPVIEGKSKEKIYINSGEGCLSVDRDTEGVTLRHKEISVSGYVFDVEAGKYVKKQFSLTGYLAVVFQHEYDHLNGKLFCDGLLTAAEAKKRGAMPLFAEE